MAEAIRTILLVEDDDSNRESVSKILSKEGYRVVEAGHGRDALYVARHEKPDLIILDLMMPEMGGYDFMRFYSREGESPIIILTAKLEENDKVLGLELGADDYIVKPFSPTQLIARVRAMLRRMGTLASPSLLQTTHLSLERSRNEVHCAGQPPIRLTPLETRLLEALMLNAGKVLSSETLIGAVWGTEGGDRTMLKQLVYRLRTKLEPDTSQPGYIETIPGVGYALRHS